MKYSLYILIFIAVLVLFSCKKGPKIIAETLTTNSNPVNVNNGSTGIFEGGYSAANYPTYGQGIDSEIHTVKVEEVLPTNRYIYIKVNEKGEEFWIATSKQEVMVGGEYTYTNALLKTNFESKEHNRVFDRLYLVSALMPATASAVVSGQNGSTTKANTIIPGKEVVVEGSVRIKEIVENPQKYNGKTIQISGVCTKINPNIMGRNWIHLKDGSKDDFDMVVTSNVDIPVGHIVTFLGTLAVNKDFGAGYKYELILENAEIVRLK